MARQATKAEIADILAKTEEREAAFRREVVRVARLAGARHDWCSVVEDQLRKLGLQEEMGVRYHLSYKSENMRKWQRASRGYSSPAAVKRSNVYRDVQTYDRRIVSVDGWNNETVVSDVIPAATS